MYNRINDNIIKLREEHIRENKTITNIKWRGWCRRKWRGRGIAIRRGREYADEYEAECDIIEENIIEDNIIADSII